MNLGFQRHLFTRVEFETGGFIAPVEIISSVVGLLGILLISFILISGNSKGIVNKMVGFA